MKDIYWLEIASKKASPVSIFYNGAQRVVASSSQIKFKGKRYTLTNHHVCRVAARELQIPREAGRGMNVVTDKQLVGQSLKIGNRVLKILALDTEHDLCILEPDLNKGSFNLASSFSIGEKVTLIGHPRGLAQTIREGRTISVDSWVAPWLPNSNAINSILISTTTYGGNSGSPVLNRFGNLVGVLFAGRNGIHTEGSMVPLENVKNFLNRFND